MKIALAQINTTVGDFAGNSKKIIEFTNEAKDNGANLVVFPELSLCGYPVLDLANNPPFLKAQNEAFEELLTAIPEGIHVIIGHIYNKFIGKPYNTASLIQKNKVLFRQFKTLLPTYDVFDEHRNFSSASEQFVFELHGEKIGLAICEDFWINEKLYDKNPIESLVKQGAEILINVSASPFEVGKWFTREKLLTGIVEKYGVQVVYANSVGGNDHLVFDGYSMALNRNGKIIATSKMFEEDLIIYDTKNKKPYGVIGPPSSCEEEEIFNALSLGLKDYLRKTGFKKVVIGASGGLDSSISACIAVNALGKNNVTLIRLPSEYSSKNSLNDAQQLAKNLDVKMHTMKISGLVSSAFSTFTNGFRWNKNADEAKELKEIYSKSPLTHENIQSRLRMVLLMAYANGENSLLISNGNKSEFSCGYVTTGGDTTAGISLLSDVYKTKLYDITRWINRNEEVIPKNIIDKAPSAELRPNQKDTDSLPDYVVLDNILKLYIEEQFGVNEIVDKTSYDRELVRSVVRKVDLSEYKRQQAPFGIKITPKAFGRGRRVPIARSI